MLRNLLQRKELLFFCVVLPSCVVFAGEPVETDLSLSIEASATAGYDLDGGEFGIKNVVETTIVARVWNRKEYPVEGGYGEISYWDYPPEDAFIFRVTTQIQQGDAEYSYEVPYVYAKVRYGSFFLDVSSAYAGVDYAYLDNLLDHVLLDEPYLYVDGYVDNPGVAAGVSAGTYYATLSFSTPHDWDEGTGTGANEDNAGFVSLEGGVDVSGIWITGVGGFAFGNGGKPVGAEGNPVATGVLIYTLTPLNDVFTIRPSFGADVRIEGENGGVGGVVEISGAFNVLWPGVVTNTYDPDDDVELFGKEEDVESGIGLTVAYLMGLGRSDEPDTYFVKLSLYEPEEEVPGLLEGVGMALVGELLGSPSEDLFAASQAVLATEVWTRLGIFVPRMGVVQVYGGDELDSLSFLVSSLLEVFPSVEISLEYRSGNLLLKEGVDSGELYGVSPTARLGLVTAEVTVSF
ncbi:hypothetical protein Spith_0439 [Spirochaeta thermophila DSM 6578]|uniref:Uncharacterized protein n=1 Tax=Winmispira thermophila (strain ATCC 700085 / DSM 6578 / Z-1203) TaxID=869211 RepID=G0GEN5_WINT7|nr:hypothetical protein [Spirochaeta thermophila]AEJ60723.1 hypothetical protein Spith_0439 [Spirochaeta thermophila DSM 6578]